MPPRPFPLPLSIGTDIIRIQRVRDILSDGDENIRRYLRRFLTPREQNYALRWSAKLNLEERGDFNRYSHFLAGRWAAKEATMKAVTWRRLTFHDIVIQIPREGGAPYAIVLDKPERSQSRPAHGTESVHVGRTGIQHDLDATLSGSANVYKPLGNTGFGDITDEFNGGTLEQYQTESREPALSQSLNHFLRSPSPPLDDDVESLSGQIAQISISHDYSYATAVCLAAQEPMEGDVGGEAAARKL